METMIRHSNKRPLVKYASFYTPSHHCTIQVTPSAIAFGRFPPPPCKATPSHVTAINSRDKKTYNRSLIEACCNNDSVLCAETKE
eukprot:7185072-Heterocapsa_arctica.AAC.1